MALTVSDGVLDGQHGDRQPQIIATLRSPWIAQGIFVVAALMWLIPDRRIKQTRLVDQIIHTSCHKRLMPSKCLGRK
jgi:hypothetical protein